MDTQLKIHIMDMAWKFVEDSRIGESATAKRPVEDTAKRFDEAYKAIKRTSEI